MRSSFLKQRGARLIGELRAKFPGVLILIVCAKADESTAVEGMKAGAHGARPPAFRAGRAAGRPPRPYTPGASPLSQVAR
jgi:hypothetical protein